MQIATPDFAPRDYYVIGKLMGVKNPEAAKELLSDYHKAQAKALDTDLHNLNFYFLTYCKQQGIDDPFELMGATRTRESADRRKVFVGAMCRIFKPQLFTHDINVSDGGLKEKLCVVLQYENSNMTTLVDEIKTWYTRDFMGYTEQVDGAVEKLISARDGYNSDLFRA